MTAATRHAARLGLAALLLAAAPALAGCGVAGYAAWAAAAGGGEAPHPTTTPDPAIPSPPAAY